MKRILLLLSILFFAAEVSWSYSNGDHQFIPIRVLDNSTETGRENRSLEYVPFQAYYDSFTSSIYLSFFENIGEVEISITNAYTGYCVDYDVYSDLGEAILLVSGGCGLYIMTVLPVNGGGYEGEFEL